MSIMPYFSKLTGGAFGSIVSTNVCGICAGLHEMLMLQTRPITVEEFDEFIRQPEYARRDFELIAGKIVEKMVSKPRASMIAARIASLIGVHIQPQNLGRVTGADGGYRVGTDRYIPDAAYISKARQPNIPDTAYNPLPPDLAVEVLSLSNTSDEMRIKIANYLAARSVVWVVDGDRQRIEVYQPGQAPQVFGVDDMLEGDEVLPGFRVSVKAIFAD